MIHDTENAGSSSSALQILACIPPDAGTRKGTSAGSKGK